MPTRRAILKAAGGLALVPLVNVPLKAAEKVPLDDPAAVALKYVEDASQAVGRMDKMGVAAAEQLCSNCRFYVAADGGYGPCALFQQRLVAADGWCAGWVPTA